MSNISVKFHLFCWSYSRLRELGFDILQTTFVRVLPLIFVWFVLVNVVWSWDLGKKNIDSEFLAHIFFILFPFSLLNLSISSFVISMVLEFCWLTNFIVQFNVWTRYMWHTKEETSRNPFLSGPELPHQEGVGMWNRQVNSFLHIYSSARCLL